MQQPTEPGNPMWDVKYPEPIAKQIKDGLDRRDALGWAPASYEQGLQVMFLLFGGWPAWRKLNEPAEDLSAPASPVEELPEISLEEMKKIKAAAKDAIKTADWFNFPEELFEEGAAYMKTKWNKHWAEKTLPYIEGILGAANKIEEELAKAKDELRVCIRERNKYIYQLDTLTEAKPSPVIEIGEPEKTGIELIAEERKEQIEKHGRTVEADIAQNEFGQLGFASVALCSEYDVTGRARGDEPARIAHFERWRPMGWDKEIWMKMIKKPYEQRLIIAGALIAAEIDRLRPPPIQPRPL